MAKKLGISQEEMKKRWDQAGGSRAGVSSVDEIYKKIEKDLKGEAAAIEVAFAKGELDKKKAPPPTRSQQLAKVQVAAEDKAKQQFPRSGSAKEALDKSEPMNLLISKQRS